MGLIWTNPSGVAVMEQGDPRDPGDKRGVSPDRENRSGLFCFEEKP